ncbi:uronate isomerase [Streptococcus dysgalactiae subsp. equisimilis GGS_124]|nr:uronate isomerase [Streptococcus dysgalactiae subsp. equisimilis GGS_124]
MEVITEETNMTFNDANFMLKNEAAKKLYQQIQD